MIFFFKTTWYLEIKLHGNVHWMIICKIYYFLFRWHTQDGCYYRNKSGMFIVQLILMIFFFYVAYEIFILKYAKKFTSIWLLLFSIYYSSVKMWPARKSWTFLLHVILIGFLLCPYEIYFMCSWNRFVLALYDFGDKKPKKWRGTKIILFCFKSDLYCFFPLNSQV